MFEIKCETLVNNLMNLDKFTVLKINMYRIKIIFALLFITCSVFSQTEPGKKGTKAVITTELGNIEILLYDETPLHRDNFIKLIKDGFYDSLLFHRVVKSFVVQGGDPNSRNAARGELIGGSGPGYTVPAEIHPSYYHKNGAIAAARQSDQVNPMKLSSGSQFYIVVGNILTIPQLNQLASQGTSPPFTEQMIKDYTSIGGTPHLDGAYTVFGEVTKGIEIVTQLSLYPVDSYSRPITDIRFSIHLME